MVQSLSPESPERRAARGAPPHLLARLGVTARVFEVGKRIAVGVYSDGFVNAGNLAYLSLVSLFPFCIVLAALAHALGRTPDIQALIDGVLRTLPATTRDLVRAPITDVLAQRTGGLLWAGALLGLWTTGGFIETIRDILRRAYGVAYSQAFWKYRLGSAAMIVGSVVLLFMAFAAQLLLTGVEQLVVRLFPDAVWLTGWIGWSRLAPLLAIFVALYLVFWSLTPSRYRRSGAPKWPGAALTALWWVATTMALPWALARLGGYGRTYGSLAGVVVSLLFFWLVGFGLVIGAQLNAALAEDPDMEVGSPPQPREREE